MARETDRDSVSKADILFADQLAKNIWPPRPELEENHWLKLTQSLVDVIQDIKTASGGGSQPQIKRPDRDLDFVVYELEEDPPVSIEKAIEAEADNDRFPKPGIAIGLVNWKNRNSSRAYLLMPWKQRKNLPSIAHLIKIYGETYGLQGWVGSQDAMHLRVMPEQRGYEELIETLPGQLRRFCNRVAKLPFGSRQPHAWAAQFIHKQATEILEKLDLFKHFVKPENRCIFFEPEGTQIMGIFRCS